MQPLPPPVFGRRPRSSRRTALNIADRILDCDCTASILSTTSDGSSPTHSDGASILYWQDLSGNNRHITATGVGSVIGPILDIDGINGLPGLAFNGTDMSMRHLFGGDIELPAMTAFVVVSVTSNPGGSKRLFAAYNLTGGNDDFDSGFCLHLGASSSATFNNATVRSVKEPVAADLKTSSTAFGTPVLLTFQVDETLTSLRVDGVAEGTRVTAATSLTVDVLRVASGLEGGAFGFHSNVKYGAVSAFGRVLTTDERDAIEAYYLSTFGIG